VDAWGPPPPVKATHRAREQTQGQDEEFWGGGGSVSRLSEAGSPPATMRQLGLTVGLNFQEFLDRQATFLAVSLALFLYWPLTCLAASG